MKLNKLEVLEKDEIALIHGESLKLLEKIGVKVESEEARDLLKENGAIVDNSTCNVKFPEELITEQLKHVPNKFTLWGSDGSFNFEVNTKSVNFATVGTPVKIYDSSNKKGVRKTILEDNIKQIRIVDTLKNIMCSHTDVWPNDVPYLELHYHVIKAWATHSSKPYGLGCLGRVASQDMMNLVSIIVEGKEELIKKPRLVGFFNPVSPLILNKLQLNGLFVFAKHNQPTIIAPAASAGATAPVTLAGLLIQSNMETLSSITLTQLINPGCPVFYSTMNAPMDPPTGNVAWGSIETGLITIGVAQLARYYNIPSRGPGLVTESKCFDIQNGYERFMTLFCAANAGINYITCAGTYESSLAEALELLVIDDELIDIVKRGFNGIRVDDESIAIDEITKVASEGKNYLMLKHTSKNIRKELYVPKLADRDRRGTWQRNGAKDIILRAKEKVDTILDTQKGPGISKDVEEKLEKYFKIISSRNYDDFRKAEDMDEAAVPKIVNGLEE
ncbi:MAG: trimethylamine methyltransferase family protein [Candidatus Lokiarchaeota archaeon]|nr:trimethylamine methyltransferase family protein [Candidatus Lokiarchaeota archaeon]